MKGRGPADTPAEAGRCVIPQPTYSNARKAHTL